MPSLGYLKLSEVIETSLRTARTGGVSGVGAGHLFGRLVGMRYFDGNAEMYLCHWQHQQQQQQPMEKKKNRNMIWQLGNFLAATCSSFKGGLEKKTRCLKKQNQRHTKKKSSVESRIFGPTHLTDGASFRVGVACHILRLL